MKRTRWSHYAIGVLACAWVFASSPAHSEIFLAAQVGGNFPQDLEDVRGVGDSAGLVASDLSLKNAVVFGGKIGGYFPGIVNWLGVETEVYYTNPDIEEQPATISAPAFGLSASGTFPATSLDIVTWAFNGLLRYPGDRFQPYVGVGVGLNFANLSGGAADQSETAFAPTLNLLGGVRVFITKMVAVFGEYKYNQGTFEFSNNEVEAKYKTNMALGGVSLHF